MRRELKNIAEYQKPSNDAFAVVRSFGEANNRLKALAVELGEEERRFSPRA